jgi:hypothetical protein
VRRVRGTPLVVFGVLVLGPSPFYWQSIEVCPGGRACGGVTMSARLGTVVLALPFDRTNAWVNLYWLCALAIGLIATAFFYRRRARKSEVDVRAWPAAVLGALALGLLIATSPSILRGHRLPSWLVLSDLHLRGTTPLLVLAIVIVALGVIERSWALGAFSGVFLFFALLANLYDMENVVARLGWWVGPQASNIPNVAIPGLVLLLGGAVFTFLDHSSDRLFSTRLS